MSQVTKRALEQSLKNLLLKKPLTKITVGDITDDCGINRMTFYYHFKDIYDLVEWSCLEDAKRALDEKKTYDTWQQGLLQIFYAVKENKPFIMNVYRCVDREQVEKYLKPLTAPVAPEAPKIFRTTILNRQAVFLRKVHYPMSCPKLRMSRLTLTESRELWISSICRTKHIRLHRLPKKSTMRMLPR